MFRGSLGRLVVCTRLPPNGRRLGAGIVPARNAPAVKLRQTPWHLGLLLELAFNSLGTYLSQVKCKMRMPPLG